MEFRIKLVWRHYLLLFLLEFVTEDWITQKTSEILNRSKNCSNYFAHRYTHQRIHRCYLLLLVRWLSPLPFPVRYLNVLASCSNAPYTLRCFLNSSLTTAPKWGSSSRYFPEELVYRPSRYETPTVPSPAPLTGLLHISKFLAPVLLPYLCTMNFSRYD